ncbi:acyl carrier protein [uncultured Piscinibacter sp.]|uniref:acyl carrier protein n=1 Tax=uncultured Piscinibacter sp. TaxID=1131835 RepID=UPI0026355D5E|nr:acyl carrier protein [uncultured Piscinibacter sp.]
MQDIKAEVRRYIEDNFIMGAGGVTLADEDSFLEHHVLDSTGFLELIGHLEETYGIKVLDDEMVPENLDSLASVADFIERKRAA